MKNVRILAYKDCWAIRAKICIPRGQFQLVFIRLTYYLSRKRANFGLQLFMGYEDEKMYF